MPNSSIIGAYILDTLQMYFAWDDDLYTHLKERGFGQGGFQRKTLPIIYSDDCESTTGEREKRRKYVINPRYFGKTYEELGWRETERESEPIIGPEKPKLLVSLSQDGNNLTFRIDPKVEGREQYHLEFSSMAAFGRLYTNWVIPVLKLNDFTDLLERLNRVLSLRSSDLSSMQILEESKQNQRERLVFVEVPVDFYKFSIGAFLYAREFLSLNGVAGTLPSLIFKNDSARLEKMSPILKVGFVHTTKEDGFEVRRPQCASKIAQPKMTTSLRGKRSKTKGLIALEEDYENYFIVPAHKFALSAQAIWNAEGHHIHGEQ
jgi:hypothetical protein